MTEKRRPPRNKLHGIQHILTGLLIIMLLYIAWYRWDSSRLEEKNRQLLELAGVTLVQEETGASAGEVEIVPETDMEGGGNREDGDLPDEAQEPTVQRDYESLLTVNPDVRGWITIPGTDLSLPVLQGEDNEFYLDHDFYKEKDRHGSIFADSGTDLAVFQPNTVLYGHHMRDGSMFGQLEHYADEAYYREHPAFTFDSCIENRTYEILAVVKVSLGDETFRYYDYKNMTEEAEFEEYYQQIKARSLYEIPVTAQYGDELVTLCTCDYSVQYGRLLVIGRKIT